MSDIRNIFKAGEDKVFIFGDYSKQEVAVAASICGDKKLIDALNSGLDLYSQIASIAYNNKYEDNLEFYPDGTTNKEGKHRRSACKAIVLGLMYSKGVKAIGEDLNISFEKAQEVYDAVLGAFPDLDMWIRDVQEGAKKVGFVEGYYGRRRRLPDLLLPDYDYDFDIGTPQETIDYYTTMFNNRLANCQFFSDKQRVIEDIESKGVKVHQNGGFKAKALRECVNSIVQGSSADICKRSLIALYNNKRLQEMGCKIILSVHDEQCISCPKQYAYEASKLLQELMISSAGNIPVKLKVDIAISDVWYGEEYTFDDNHNLVKR